MIFAENILLCIAVPLVVSLLFIRGNARRFEASFLLGMGVCLLAGYISGYISHVSNMGNGDTAVFIAPIVEESMKFVPLLLFLLLFDPADENLFLAAAGIGAGFGTFENCCYLLTSGTEHFGMILIRGMAVGVMHIVSLMALATGLVLARRFHVLTAAGFIGALSLSMTFHGLYNLLASGHGISSAIAYVLPVLTGLLLFIPFRRIMPPADKEMQDHLLPF